MLIVLAIPLAGLAYGFATTTALDKTPLPGLNESPLSARALRRNPR
ncbi:MAG: hypothetical protein QM744_15210 [Mesorhizobium sp.]